MPLPDRISVEDFFSPPTSRGRDDLAGRHQIAYLAPWKEPAQRLGAGASTATTGPTRALRHRRRDPQRPALLGGPTTRAGCSTCRTPAATRTGTSSASTSTTPTHPPSTSPRSPAPMAAFELHRPTGPARRSCSSTTATRSSSTSTNSTSPPANSRMLAENPGTVVGLAGEPRRRPVRHDADRRRRLELVALDTGPARCARSRCSTAPTTRWASTRWCVTPDGTGVWLGSNRGHRPHPAGPPRPGHRRGDRGRQPPDARPRRARRGRAACPPLILQPRAPGTARGALSR